MRHRILVVDDDPAILDALKRCLRRQFQVDTAASAQAALFLISVKGPYAAVLADLIMPDVGGIELLCQVRQLAPATARLALSGCADSQTFRDAFQKAGVHRFLSKPCPLNEMIDSLHAAIADVEASPTAPHDAIAV